MPSTPEIASWVVNGFNPKETYTVERIVEKVLVEHGTNSFDAPEEAEKKSAAVLDALQKMPLENLPFDFSVRDNRRLVGKQRVLTDDTPETKEMQARIELIGQMSKEVFNLGDKNFEKLCAKLMHLSGAKEAFAQCTNDDGGIDIYGRLPIRLSDPKVRTGLLRSAILEKSVLFLGQCKCQTSHVEPGDINNFQGAAEDCLRKYEGSNHPPSHRVPDAYYKSREMCIRVFFTTASYTQKATSKAESLDIAIVNGRQIAEFLIYHGIGLMRVPELNTYQIDPAVLLAWVTHP
jgi:hypothetical protein